MTKRLKFVNCKFFQSWCAGFTNFEESEYRGKKSSFGPIYSAFLLTEYSLKNRSHIVGAFLEQVSLLKV